MYVLYCGANGQVTVKVHPRLLLTSLKIKLYFVFIISVSSMVITAQSIRFFKIILYSHKIKIFTKNVLNYLRDFYIIIMNVDIDKRREMKFQCQD